LVYDLLTRWFTELGFEVTLIRNITDIDDKVLEKAGASGVDWRVLAQKNERIFSGEYAKLQILEPAAEPRATGHITQMLTLIEKLIELGHAYQVPGSSDVYFDTASWKDYGELTNQDLADMESEESTSGKKSSQDFALWKSAKVGEPHSASWPSKFGAGRPGWHIECSAMSTYYLGANFDIHGGGLDLRFPHHENELAQSRAAGHEFANYWIHNGLVSISGQKMSKSIGNTVSATELFELASPAAVRYYLAGAHYRSVLDYQPSLLGEAQAALERLHGFVERAERELAGTQFESDSGAELPAEFVEHMNDDLNIPAALAVLHESVTEGNTQLDGLDFRSASVTRNQVVKMLSVLGLAPEQWQESSSRESAVLDALIGNLIAERNQARADRNFDRADQIRDQLAELGIELSDGSNGTHWSLS
jgi:cysteinyl-tRNA synthetase